MLNKFELIFPIFFSECRKKITKYRKWLVLKNQNTSNGGFNRKSDGVHF